ncbi:MAG: hypothetical protein ACTSRZ_00005 [Promethearchaeota archaeon]
MVIDMKNSGMKIITLIGMTIFLFIGTSILVPLTSNLIENSYVGDIPLDEKPNSSSYQTFSGNDGSNIGIVGRANGTKQGIMHNNPSEWYHEAPGQGNYYRSEKISFPVPDENAEAKWKVKDIYATVNNLTAKSNFVQDPNFEQSNIWAAEDLGSRFSNFLYMNPGSGTQTLISGTIGTINAPGNNYFNGKEGAQFTVGSNKLDQQTSFKTSSGLSFIQQPSSNVLYQQYSQSKAGHRDEGFGGNPSWTIKEMACAIMGYQKDSGWWNDNYYSHNGVPAYPTQPNWNNFAGHTEWKKQYTHNTATGEISVWSHLWTLGSVGATIYHKNQWYDPTAEELWAIVTTTWNDHADYDLFVEKEIPWIDDDSPPYVSLSYTVQLDSSKTSISRTWVESNSGSYKNDALHEENARIILNVQLVNPYGGVEKTLDTFYFGNGPDYNGNPSYITDTNPRTKNHDLSNDLYHTPSENSWKIRFDIQIDLDNDGNFQSIQDYRKADPWGGSARAAKSVELQVKNSIGLILKNFNMQVNDERPWDTDLSTPDQYNEVYVKHTQINFNERNVPETAEPVIEFDWYVPSNIIGHKYPNENPAFTGLEYGQPFARLEWNHPINGSGSYTFLDYETIADVIRRPASSVQVLYPWLAEDDPSQWGGDHFKVSWPDGAQLLDGISTLDIYVGFRFYDKFNVDYDLPSSNTTLCITNVTFMLDTNPYPEELNMQLVWDKQGDQTDIATADVKNIAQGSGYVDTMNLSGYTDLLNLGRTFYWRVLDSARSCYFEYSITLIIEYEYWGYTTTYHIDSNGDAIFYANFSMPIPKSGLTIDYSQNFWFDLIFPRYQMENNGEPYWDLDYAYESSRPSELKLGEENLTIAFSALSTKIAVFENETDPYGIGNIYYDVNYLGNLAEYHQFARFHKELISEYLYKDWLDWNIQFSAPNYVSDIILDKDSNFDEDYTKFYEDEWVMVKGVYSVPMYDIYNYNPRGDIGEYNISWHYSGNASLLPGGNQNPYVGLVQYGDTSYNVTNDYHIIAQSLPPNDGYWVSFKYKDSNVCGDTYNQGQADVYDGYCSGIFRLGYKLQEFSITRQSYIDGGVFIPLPKSADNVATYNNCLSNPFPIMIKWRDAVTDDYLIGAEAKISISSYIMNESSDIKKFIIYEEYQQGSETKYWKDVPMTDLQNGSYIVWIDPTTKYHQGNMTWGFHNFTIYIDKPGYEPSIIQSNFSIVVDTVMKVLNPSHDQFEQSDFNSEAGNVGRPNFDTNNAFAGANYTFTVEISENLTGGEFIINRTGGPYFYQTHVKLHYWLLGYRDPQSPGEFHDYLEPGFIDWNYVNTHYPNGNSFVNGTFTTTLGNIYEASIQWPKFSEQESGYNAILYKPNLHIYYNITFTVDVNRTQYTENRWWQPNDVLPQWCEDNPSDSVNPNVDDRDRREEIIGFTLHREDSGNSTYLMLINNVTDNNNAFAMGEFSPDPSGTHEYDNFTIVNYWYNATGDKFRLRVLFNCTKDQNGFNDAPPVGPLNKSSVQYGVNYTWMGETEITLHGWNDSVIELQNDSSYLWNCTVYHKILDQTITAYGETYVTPWLYFKDINSTTTYENNTKYLTIKARKHGFIDDSLTIKLVIMDQNTTVYNDTTSEIYNLTNSIKLSIPTGIPTSFILRYNDTTNVESGINVGISGATIECIQDDWNGHFVDGYGSTWNFTPLGNGRYNITLIDTKLNVLNGPSTKTFILRFNKGNYSEYDVKVELTLLQRRIEIKYIGGKDEGLYTPTYLTDIYDQLGHINLTFKILDLDNNSVSIDFDESIIDQKFNFYHEDGIQLYERKVIKEKNSSGVFYHVLINTHLDLDDINHPDYKDFLVNFSLQGIINYHSNFTTHWIRIYAITMGQINRSSTNITLQYLWPSYSDWLSSCPLYSFNLTDENHTAYYNLPIDASDITSYYSTFNNPFENGSSAINPSGDNEDIYLRYKYDFDGLGRPYQYLEIIVDTRGLKVQSNLNVDITISKMNYLNVTIHVTINIINASTQIENNRISISLIDTVQKPNTPDWSKTGQGGIQWSYYSNLGGTNEIEVPWGMILAMKCGYVSGSFKISSFTGGSGNVSMAIEGLSIELTPNYEEYNNEFYYYFWAEITDVNPVNYNITLWVWKDNFEPAFYTVNFTIRPRKTQIKQISSFEQTVEWLDFAQFEFKFEDIDYSLRNNTIDDAIINGTKLGENTQPFIFSNDLNASWSFTISAGLPGSRSYIITINSSNLKASEIPYIFHFNITRLGNDGNIHWETQEFTLNLTIIPVSLTVEHFFILPGFDLNLNKSQKGDGFSIGFDPEKYQNVTIYLRIYYEKQGEKTYLTDEDINVSLYIYNWEGNNLFQLNKDNLILIVPLKFIEIENVTYKGLWTIMVNVTYGPNPEDVLFRLNAFVFNITSSNVNLAPTITKRQVYIISSEFIPPWWFWLLIGVVGAASVGFGTYTVKRLLRLRIPFVLRMINESIDLISKDKFPKVGVMRNRNELIISMIVDVLDELGIGWETSEKFEMEAILYGEEETELPPLTLAEIRKELEKIESLTEEERELFIEELKELNRTAQLDFLKSLEKE